MTPPRFDSLLTRLLVGSAIPLVLFLAAVLIGRLVAGLQMEKHTREVIILDYKIRQPLERIQTIVQNPPASRRILDLSAYRASRRDFDSLAEQLRLKVSDNPAQSQLAGRLLAEVAELDRILARQEPGREQPAADEKLADMNRSIDAMAAAEESLLETRRVEVERLTRQAVLVIAVAVTLAVVLAVFLSLQAARSVTRPVQRLRQAADDLITGQFRTVPVAGPLEVADLIVLFNHMALTLTEKSSELQQQEERYRTYIGAVARILWTTNARGEVVADLPTWRAYTGQAANALLGAGWMEAVHPEDRERALAAWQEAVLLKSIYETEFRLYSARGEYRHFSCRGVPVLTAGGEVREWIGTCIDVTEKKQQEALRQAKEAAEAASQAKSEFLARMSHELRTPLNAVIGMSRMLTTQRFGPLNAKQADYLNDITRAGEHLLALINDILDLSKVEAGKLDLQAAPFPVAAAMSSLISTLQPLADNKGLRLASRPPASDGELDTDAGRFRQILYNLLSNAIKFTPSLGLVEIAWEWVRDPTPDSPAVEEPEARAIRVSVSDTGVGIAPEDQNLVWDEFRQIRPSIGEHQGTGLGLALTRRLVALLGGSIWLKSEPGRGSEFAFAIPRHLPPREEPTPEEGGDRPLALVIEDHPPTNKLLSDWLAGAGLATASAYDGEAGLQDARRLHPALVVLDVQLPRRDGWEVLTALKSDPETSSIPVAVVTIDDDLQPTAGLGVQDFFVKPVDREAFLARIRALCPACLGEAGGRHCRAPSVRVGWVEALRDPPTDDGSGVSV